MRRELRSEAVRSFFYGPRHALVQLQPVEQSVQFASLRVYEWRQDREGAGRPVLGEVALLRDTLQGKLLAVVHAEEAQGVATANVAGFVAVCVRGNGGRVASVGRALTHPWCLAQVGRGPVSAHVAAAVPQRGPAAQQICHRRQRKMVAVGGLGALSVVLSEPLSPPPPC